MIRPALLLGLIACAAAPALAQNAVDVDPAHHRVVYEDEYVRVIRVTYPVGYKTPMHEHNQGVTVFVAPARLANTSPDGRVSEVERAPGDTGRSAGGSRHISENVGSESFEVVMIEFKKTSPVPKPAAGQ